MSLKKPVVFSEEDIARQIAEGVAKQTDFRPMTDKEEKQFKVVSIKSNRMLSKKNKRKKKNKLSRKSKRSNRK